MLTAAGILKRQHALNREWSVDGATRLSAQRAQFKRLDVSARRQGRPTHGPGDAELIALAGGAVTGFFGSLVHAAAAGAEPRLMLGLVAADVAMGAAAVGAAGQFAQRVDPTVPRPQDGRLAPAIAAYQRDGIE